MPNVVEFIVPDSTKLPLDYTLKPADFRAQFIPMTSLGPGAVPLTLPLPDPSVPAEYIQLLASALDSGYGTGTAPMPTMPLADRIALNRHLAQQLELALTLLKQSPTGHWVRQGFALNIEKTAKTTHSYLLGMLFASFATRLWGQANGWGKVREFWHYGVLASRAANFMVGIAYEEENPDFLVEFDGGSGTWACVEAKGSLGDQSNDALRTGLSQACKLTQVRWQTVGATATVVSPAQQACVMTYFAPPDETLEVLVMDPPADSVNRQSDPNGRLIFKQGGDFVRWAQAIEQFEGMAGRSVAFDSRLKSTEFDWSPSPNHRSVWVAVPKIMRRHIKTVAAALLLLDWLVPVLSNWRKKPSLTARGVNRRLSNMARYASVRANSVDSTDEEETRLQPYMWARLASFLKVRKEGNKEAMLWVQLLREIWEQTIFPQLASPSEQPYPAVKSLAGLWSLFSSVQADSNDYWERRLSAEMEDESGVDVATTQHGLYVVSLGGHSERESRTNRRWMRP